MKKILWIDTETGGLDPTRHGIHQIAGIVQIGKEVKEEFNIKMRPFDDDIMEDEALAVSNTTIDEVMKNPLDVIDGFRTLRDTIERYVDKYKPEDKFIIAGQNPLFDRGFIHNLFLKCGIIPYGINSHVMNYNCLDLLDLTKLLSNLGLLKLGNLKLDTVCKFLGISLTAHDAFSDIKATKEAYTALVTHFIKFDQN